ncbi:hypothetical protein [Rhizobium sp. CNPSo 3490]|uniref:hypothetical protein n=1 Tax=Rhizobium sp. CNPSo 3490 TaxID=3021407 RepID=UPI00254BC03F|nr:hypothetical protein [Rhizobium sp. CNPSo 3490]MDK4731116.1 hypothetical protein [Rhizobium sp. CNPSo 3490]
MAEIDLSNGSSTHSTLKLHAMTALSFLDAEPATASGAPLHQASTMSPKQESNGHSTGLCPFTIDLNHA